MWSAPFFQMIQPWVNANDPITELDITAHGAHNLIELGNGDLITTSGDGTQIIDQSAFDLTPLLNSALSPTAVVKLQGCHTGANDDFLGLKYDGSPRESLMVGWNLPSVGV